MFHFHAALRIDLDYGERVFVESPFQPFNRRDVVGIGDGVVDLFLIRGEQRLAEIVESRFEPAHLLGEGLQRHGRVGSEELLGKHRVRLQAAIARQMRLKRTPELRFRADPAVQTAQRVEDILRGLEEDRG